MLEIPVKLIVKAPNQQIEDQTIQCCLTWTIKKLKGYLSEVYPSKPNTEDQRLIYYGQLLNDSVTLKDVFTRYEAGEETHTVHLVCMPSKETLKMQARKLAEEGSKKARKEVVSNVGGGASTSQRLAPSNEDEVFNSDENRRDSPQQPPSARGCFQPAGYQNWMNRGIHSQSTMGNNYLQQWAWMQQFYAHYYMSQYMEMIARQNGLREGYPDHRQTQAAHNPEPQPARVEVEDEDNRRDWLDYFCILSRLLVLLAILYFYSSPARFLIVSSLGMALYLHQIGFFRLNQIQDLENNNEAVNNNVPGENNNLIPRAGVAEVPGAEEPEQEQQRNPDRLAENPEHPSFITLTWIFVSSFLSSIIPETQNAL